jgi:hypothetical protein
LTSFECASFTAPFRLPPPFIIFHYPHIRRIDPDFFTVEDFADRPMNFFSKIRSSAALRWAFRIGITAVFVVLVNKGVSKSQAAAIFGATKTPFILAALAFGLLSILFQILRWRAVLLALDFPVSFTSAFKTWAWGNLLAFITPGRVGEFGRALSLDPQRKADSVVAVTADKGFSVLATIIFGLAGMALQRFLCGTVPPRRLFIGMAAFLVISPIVWLLFRGAVRRGFTGPGKLAKMFALLGRMKGRWGVLFSGPIIGHSGAAHLAMLLQAAMLLAMFGSRSLTGNLVAGAESYAFMLFLPFFIANIGLREFSFGMLISSVPLAFSCGIDRASAALGVSTAILAINVIMPALAGVVVMLLDKRHNGTI